MRKPARLQVALLPGGAVELHQGHLDLGVPAGALLFRGAEDRVDVVRGAAGNLEQAGLARPALEGNRGLDEVPDAVHLVAVVEVRPAPGRVGHLDEAVQVAVGRLRGGNQIDGLVRHAVQLLIRREKPGRNLPLRAICRRPNP